MKGLLLKDLYLLGKGKWWSLAIMILASAFTALFGGPYEGLLLTGLPCMFGMWTVWIFSADERDRWSRYSDVLPCTRAQIISSKYIFGLLISVIEMAIAETGFAIYQFRSNALNLGNGWGQLFLALLFCFGNLPTAIMLPLMICFETMRDENRALTLWGVIGVAGCGMVFGACALITRIMENATVSAAFAFAVTVVIYIGSWILSVKMFEKREL